MLRIKIHYRRCAIALATLAVAGTTLGTAAPAFADQKQIVATDRHTVIGSKPGAGCSLDNGTVPDGTTVTVTYTYSDGTKAHTTSECRNGGWFPARLAPHR